MFVVPVENEETCTASNIAMTAAGNLIRSKICELKALISICVHYGLLLNC